MPFVQMENISHFLRACQSPPLNLQEHDMFLTVDLYEQKDPAQVLQCLGAFSRAANAVNPSAFPSVIGPKARGAAMSPQGTGQVTPRSRGLSNVSATSPSYGSRSAMLPSRTGDSGSGRWSPGKSPTSDRVGSPTVSSWSKKDHEGVTNPAWNIAQYGYMGGASQGNLGIAFGGRRQITSAGPSVPTWAEKERKRKEAEERQRLQMEEEKRRRKTELEAEEQRARLEEEQKWEEETRRLRAEEKRQAEEEKRNWEEEERQWRITEEKRRKEEEEAEARLVEERKRARNQSDSRLRGQFLSQYQAEQKTGAQKTSENDYSERVKQLEKELELARQREQQYEEERQQRSQRRDRSRSRARSRSRPNKPEGPPTRQDSWRPRDERDYLRTQWKQHQDLQAQDEEEAAPPPPPRPLPVPNMAPIKQNRTGEVPFTQAPITTQRTGEARPLPVPGAKSNVSGGTGSGPSSRPLPVPQPTNRTDRYLSANPAPIHQAPKQTYSREVDATAELDEEDRRRVQSQAKTKAGGRAGKSLLEREMELERQRQREWEEAQKETAKATRSGDGVDGIGGGIGGRWDVSQWSGYTGGDSQNKGSAGIGAGRRQIVGPRPLPNHP
jgi:transgelin